MPSKSAKQRRFMAAAAHNPEFARKAGISQSVAKEFYQADQRKASGGLMRMSGGLGRATGRIAPQRAQRTLDLGGVDADVTAANDSLRGMVGRLARPRSAPRAAPSRAVQSRPRMPGRVIPRRAYADGGKARALAGIQVLAKKLKEALERDDQETAGRLIRQMEKLEPGSSKSLTADPSAKARSDKLATFAKGGKVKAVAGLKAKIHGLQKRFLEISDLLTTAEDGDANIGDLEYEADQIVQKLEALGASVPDVHDSVYRKPKE